MFLIQDFVLMFFVLTFPCVWGVSNKQYNLILTGVADISAIDPGNTPGVFPRVDALTLPLFWKSNEASSRVFSDLMHKYMADTEFKKVKVVWTHTTGGYHVFTTTKPVKTLEDFEGMKFGVHSPMLTEIVKAFGAVPVFILVPEMYTALERGLLDGVLFGPNGAIAALRFPEVTKYRTYNVGVSTDPMVQVMNLDVWNSLPPDIQKIFDDTGPEWSKQVGAGFDEWDLIAKQRIEEYDKKAGNPPIYYLPKSEKARWKEALQPVIDKWIEGEEAEGRPGRAMVEDLYALQEKYEK